MPVAHKKSHYNGLFQQNSKSVPLKLEGGRDTNFGYQVAKRAMRVAWVDERRMLHQVLYTYAVMHENNTLVEA